MPDEAQRNDRIDWLVTGLLLFGALLRLLYHLQYSSSPFWGDMSIDEQLHNAWARYIADGNLIGDSAFFRAPLYAYFLALLFKIFAANLHVVLLIQHLIGVATGWLLYRTAREMFTYTVGVLSLMIFLLTPVFIYFEGQLLLDFLILPLNLLAFLFLCKAVKGDYNYNWVLSGIFFGLSAITRPNILFAVLFIVMWVFFGLARAHGMKRAVAAAAALIISTMAIIAPVTIRNYVLSNDFVLIASQGGINFYVGNHSGATGLSAHMPTLGASWDYQDCEFIAEQAEGKELLPSEVSDYWYVQGLQFILDKSDEFVPLLMKKLYHLVNNHEISNNRSIPYVYDTIWILPLLPIGVWFVLPLAVIGAYSRWRIKWTRLLVLFVIVYSFTLLMFFINSRFRLPILVMCIILAALGVDALVNLVKWKHLVRAAVMCVIAVAISVFTTGNMYSYDFHNSASEHFNMGNHLMETGRYDEALLKYHTALESRPTMNQVNLNIGNIHLKLGDLDSARYYYLRELEVTVDSVKAYGNLGVVERLAGNDSLALAYGERAVKRKPYFVDAAVNYIIAARKTRQYGDAFRVANSAIEANQDSPDLRYYRGVLYFDLGQLDSAEVDFNLALDLLEKDRQPSFGTVSELRSPEEEADSRRKTRAMAFYSLGTIAGQSGMPDSARIMLEKALALDSTLTEAKVNLASALTQLGEFREAERICKSLIEQGHRSALVWYFVSVSKADAGSMAEAEAAVDSALLLSPDFGPAAALKRMLSQRKKGGD